MADPEKTRARNAGWRAKNPERVRANYAAWAAANPDKIKARRAAWAERAKAKAAEYYIANKDRITVRNLAYRAANPEKAHAIYHARRAREKGAEGRFTGEDVRRIRIAQKDKCAICRVPLKGRGHRDHIVPLKAGGSNWPANIQLLCASCNSSKGAKDATQFMREQGRLL